MHRKFAIIGAGLSGLGMGMRLKQEGQTDFVILERAAELGGTWRDNTYPGCACDVPSHVYSYSFAQNPNWSTHYAAQPEILDYMRACAEDSGVLANIRFNSGVSQLQFDNAAANWQITLHDGRQMTAQYVISATGTLTRPNIPALPGLETFAGTRFHSSRWPVGFDPTGRQIAVIGTGASSIQFVPQIAPTAAQLSVYQRTPPWILPRNARPVPERWRRLFRRFPILQSLVRTSIFLKAEITILSFVGGSRLASAANRIGTRDALNHLVAQVDDPTLRAKLTPDYAFGCSRVLNSDDYYPALTRPNVELVTTSIARITADGIVDVNGTLRPADSLIFGTGFKAADYLVDMPIIGPDGSDLIDVWHDKGPEAYLGMLVAGYPNLFFLLGPNTFLGHTSVLLMVEGQYGAILDAVRKVERAGAATVSVRAGAQDAFVREVQSDLAQTVWQSGGCVSWYQRADGKNTTLWPGSVIAYRRRTRHLPTRDLILA